MCFGEYIAGKYFTNEQVLDILNQNIVNSELLKDAVILFDGYTGFTPIQNRIVENDEGCKRSEIFNNFGKEHKS